MRRRFLGGFVLATLLAVTSHPASAFFNQLPTDTTNPGGGSCTVQSGCMDCVFDAYGRVSCALIFGGGTGCMCTITSTHTPGQPTVTSCATSGTCTYLN